MLPFTRPRGTAGLACLLVAIPAFLLLDPFPVLRAQDRPNTPPLEESKEPASAPSRSSRDRRDASPGAEGRDSRREGRSFPSRPRPQRRTDRSPDPGAGNRKPVQPDSALATPPTAVAPPTGKIEVPTEHPGSRYFIDGATLQDHVFGDHGDSAKHKKSRFLPAFSTQSGLLSLLGRNLGNPARRLGESSMSFLDKGPAKGAMKVTEDFEDDEQVGTCPNSRGRERPTSCFRVVSVLEKDMTFRILTCYPIRQPSGGNAFRAPAAPVS